jgi:hypothetical protein
MRTFVYLSNQDFSTLASALPHGFKTRASYSLEQQPAHKASSPEMTSTRIMANGKLTDDEERAKGVRIVRAE